MHYYVYIYLSVLWNVRCFCLVIQWNFPVGSNNVEFSIVIHPFADKPGYRLNHVSYILATHYSDVIMDTIASQITSLTIVYSTVYTDADQWKHQSSASLALCAGNSPGTAQMASNAENVSIWWRHHECFVGTLSRPISSRNGIWRKVGYIFFKF